MKRALLATAALLISLIAIFVWTRRDVPLPEAERNRKFAQEMEHVTLVGHSTRLNQEGLFGPESYYIDGVTHLSGDMWLFRTRLEHGGKQIAVPIPLKVQWAGDTPVITLTDLTIPA